MAISCSALRTQLARQTPVYDEVFLQDYTSDMWGAPYLGRHQTRQWTFETDTLYFDKVHVGQPDFTATWQVINAGECASPGPCDAPYAFINWGSTRDTAFMEQLDLRSTPMCLEQLVRVPHVGEQMSKIWKNVRRIPLSYSDDFVRTRQVSYHDTLQICGSGLSTFAITTANTAANMVTLNLGSAANLPTSQLNWTYLKYLGQQLTMKGYSQDSGLPASMANLITHSLTWQNLTSQNPEIKPMLALKDWQAATDLYKLGKGISAEAFGFISPTFDEQQLRFQLSGTSLLERVLPYLNSPATTGEKPIVNPAYLNARYAISQFIHPKASVVYTPKGAKIHEMIPTISASMYGKWKFVNPEGVIMWYNTDGTTCTKNNDKQQWFYWLCPLQQGFRYDQRELQMPILHLIDGSGSACMVNTPVCGTAPQYVEQNYDDDPAQCDA